MMIESTMKSELAARSDAVALACLDTRSGLVLGMGIRSDVARDDVENVALSAAQLCLAPPAAFGSPYESEVCDEAFVISPSWIHAYARVPGRRDLLVVCLATGSANLGVLQAWVRAVAERVGPTA